MPEAPPAPSSEAVMRSIASREAEKTPAGSAQNDKRRANEIRTQLVQESSRASLEGIASNTPKRGEIKALADENIGTKIDPNTGEKVRTGTKQVDFDDVIKSVDNLFQYLETGKLNPKDAAQVRADIEEIFRMYPGTEDIIGDLGSKAVTDTVLNDPDFRKALQERLTEIKSNRVAEINPGAEAALKEAQREEKAKERERDRIKGEADAVRKGLESFEINRGTPGEKRRRLDELTNDKIPTLKEESKKAEAEIRNLDRLIKSQETKRGHIDRGQSKAGDYDEVIGNVDKEITRLEGLKDEKQAKIDEYNKAEAEKTQLEQERAELREDKARLEPEEDKTASELDELHEKTLSAQTALARAVKARTDQEREFMLSIEDVYKDSAVKYYEDKVREAEEAQQVILKKQIEGAKGDMDRLVLEQLGGNRWKMQDTKRGLLGRNKNVVVPNRTLVDADYRDMLLNGPDATLRGILTGLGVPLDQMNEMLNDSKYKDMMIKQVVVNRMQTAKITGDEARAIASSEWGSEAISKALAANSEANNMVNELRANGVLRGSTPAEWIRQHPGKSLAAILLMLLGPTAALGVAALGGIGWGTAVLAAGSQEAAGAVGIGVSKLSKMTL